VTNCAKSDAERQHIHREKQRLELLQRSRVTIMSHIDKSRIYSEPIFHDRPAYVASIDTWEASIEKTYSSVWCKMVRWDRNDYYVGYVDLDLSPITFEHRAYRPKLETEENPEISPRVTDDCPLFDRGGFKPKVVKNAPIFERMAPEIIPDDIYHEPVQRERVERDPQHTGSRCLVNPPIRMPVRRPIGGTIEPQSQYRANGHEFFEPPITSQPMYSQVVLTREEINELGLEWLNVPPMFEMAKPAVVDGKKYESQKRPYAKRKPQELVPQSEIDGWTARAREMSKRLNHSFPPMRGYCCASASGLKLTRHVRAPAPQEMKMAA
jgi:hypothetical protein